MSEHLEIEFKTLVSPQDFKRLIDHFAIQNGLLRKQIIILIRTIFN